MLALHQVVGDHLRAVQILLVHVHRVYLAVLVGGVVVDALVLVAAAAVDGNLVAILAQLAEAALLLDAAKDVEELAHGLGLAASRLGVHAGKDRLGKARGAGEVARQAHAAHAAAVGVQVQARGEAVLSLLDRDVAVVGQHGHLHVEGGVVGEDAHRVVVDVKAAFGLLHHDGPLLVGDNPVQGVGRQVGSKVLVGHVGVGEQGAGLLHRGAGAQDPGDYLEGRDVVPALLRRAEVAVVGEVEAGHTQAPLVDAVVVQRRAPHDEGHADNGQMAGYVGKIAQLDGVVARCDGHLLLI